MFVLEEDVTKADSTDKTIFHHSIRFPISDTSPHSLSHQHLLTSLPTSVIKCSGFSLAQPIINEGNHVRPQNEDFRRCHQTAQLTSYIKLSKDYVKFPRELFLQRAEEQPNAVNKATASTLKNESNTNPRSLSSSQNGTFVKFFKDEPSEGKVGLSAKIEGNPAVSATSFVGKTEPGNAFHHDHQSRINNGVYRITPVSDSRNSTSKNDQLIPSPISDSTCSNRFSESHHASYVTAASRETDFHCRSKFLEKNVGWMKHTSRCSLPMFPPTTFRLKPLGHPLLSPTQMPGLAPFPVNFPQHPVYTTGIPENLSPPPALSVSTKFGSMPTSPLTSPKLIPRPMTLGYGVTHYDRDDDARSTSSASSSMSSGSLPSPRRPERMSTHVEVGRGYSTSTPSPMTSPSSHGQLSPAVS